ncbi:hypothetical protein [Streptomyces halstedii]|uniref:Uncharacterized protein n=1 Tax=Streptomyces halstedii TaxID=1944 RepID=A0A6N9TW74_STRHA|nr:hypothetical protein [Streptomyces halstedii]NEA15754.1 hypothetical protein [Streptomyces halstedii]
MSSGQMAPIPSAPCRQLSESAAQEGLGKFLRNNPPGRMDFIRIVGDGYDITYP